LERLAEGPSHAESRKAAKDFFSENPSNRPTTLQQAHAAIKQKSPVFAAWRLSARLSSSPGVSAQAFK
jgi:hypothetical protein